MAFEPGQSSCKKLGINYAVVGPVTSSVHDRAANLKLGFTLEIATDPNQVWGIADSFNYSLDHGLTPILRICYGNTCGFTDPNDYVNFLNQLADLVGQRTFYALAGPNEPISETWLGGTPGDWQTIAPLVTTYMNAIINGVNQPNVKLLSPAFNLTHPTLNQEVTLMRQSGAKFNLLSGIAGNAYNLKGYIVDNQLRETISSQAARLREVDNNLFTNSQIFLTEIGMFESETNLNWTGTKVAAAQAYANLAREVEILRRDPQILSFLLFDSFGTNPDQNFSYNFLTDNQITGLFNPLCALPNDVDINRDGILDGLDVQEQLLNWFFPQNLRSDTNGSGQVNGFDFGLLARYWID